MTVVFERPYRFVPPHRGNAWPNFIQAFRLIDWHLRRNEGVVAYECRNGDRLRDSLDRGDGILLAPNHCRYADPIVLGWLAREVKTHVYAVASWHLFNEGAFRSFALRRMGAFSLYREGSDRQSLETAIQILETAERPLILFPEGTTNRTNDELKPLLDGVTFIARSAARRRAKRSGGRVVIHPIGLKYLCEGDFSTWADRELTELESRFGWRQPYGLSLLQRTVRFAEAMLSLREIECFGRSRGGDLRDRRDALIVRLLEEAEAALELVVAPGDSIRDRVRKIRAEAAARYFEQGRTDERDWLEDIVARADSAQLLLSFPDRYLDPRQVTDTRLVETIQRMQESMYGKAHDTMTLRAVMDVGEPIEVPPEKGPRGRRDPLLETLRERLETMLEALSQEARPLREDGDAGAPPSPPPDTVSEAIGAESSPSGHPPVRR